MEKESESSLCCTVLYIYKHGTPEEIRLTEYFLDLMRDDVSKHIPAVQPAVGPNPVQVSL